MRPKQGDKKSRIPHQKQKRKAEVSPPSPRKHMANISTPEQRPHPPSRPHFSDAPPYLYFYLLALLLRLLEDERDHLLDLSRLTFLSHVFFYD